MNRTIASALLAPTLMASAASRADDWDGPDKRAHFVMGFGIAANASLLARVAFDDPTDRALVGFGFGIVAGAGKEGADALGLGTPSLPDLVWTALGATAGALVLWLIDGLED